MTDRKRNNALNVRIDDAEVRMLAALAANEGLPVSSWIRRTIRTIFQREFPQPIPAVKKKRAK